MTRFKAGAPYIDLVRQCGVESPATERWASEQIATGATPTLQLAVYRDGDLALSLAWRRSLAESVLADFVAAEAEGGAT